MKTGISSARHCALSLAVVAAFPVLAQSDVTPSLKDVVVIATRIEQPITDVVADVSIIDRAEIERSGATSVQQILARLPGLQAISYGDASRLYIRGADAYMTAVYIDGVRVYSQDGVSVIGGGAPWELIPAGQIDRIEVLRGPASAVYGSDAMGGVIQIFTRKGESGFRPFVNLGIGSFGLLKTDAGFNGAQNGFDYAVSLSYQNLDGFNTRPDLIRTPNQDGSVQQASSLNLGYQVTARHRVELSSFNSMVDSQYPFYDWTAATAKEVPSKGTVGNSAVKWSGQWTDTYQSAITLSRSAIAKRDSTPNDYETRLNGTLFENKFRLGQGMLSAVLEQKADEFSATADGNGNPAFQGSRTQNALALGYGLHSGRHFIQVNAREDRDELYGTHQTGALAYGFSLTDGWRLTASTGTAFKSPTLTQIFSQYGNTQLKAETNESQEIGFAYAEKADALKVTVYRNVIKDLISSAQTVTNCSAGWFCYYNVGQASINGVTVSGKTMINGVGLRGTVDVLDPRNDVTGRLLSLRARETATIGLDTSIAGWQWGVELQHVGDRFNEAANTNKMPAYDLLNLTASKALGGDWRLVVRVDNATDQTYTQVLDTSVTPTVPYITPRATYFVGLQWQPRN